MSKVDLFNLIDKALIYYDNKNKTFKKYIKSDDVSFDREKQIINFNNINKNNKFEVLGVFDNNTSIWMWAWMVPEFMTKETIIVKKLLHYGLKLNPDNQIKKLVDDKLYLKTQLVNSRFLLNDNFQLELHLAISSYLAKDNFKFIYPRIKYLNPDKTKFITVYYLII